MYTTRPKNKAQEQTPKRYIDLATTDLQTHKAVQHSTSHFYLSYMTALQSNGSFAFKLNSPPATDHIQCKIAAERSHQLTDRVHLMFIAASSVLRNLKTYGKATFSRYLLVSQMRHVHCTFCMPALRTRGSANLAQYSSNGSDYTSIYNRMSQKHQEHHHYIKALCMLL